MLSADSLREALRKFSDWLKGAEGVVVPWNVFLRDPASWATYRVLPKDSGAPVTRQGHSRAIVQRSGTGDDQFRQFRQLYEGIGAVVIEADWDKAYGEWAQLTEDERLLARHHIVTCDPAFVKLPRNYLKDKEFNRKSRPKPKVRDKMEELYSQMEPL
jgi:hypothetical protein